MKMPINSVLLLLLLAGCLQLPLSPGSRLFGRQENFPPFRSVTNRASVSAPRGEVEARVWGATFALYAQKGGEAAFGCTATAYKRVPGGYYLLGAGHCVRGLPEGAALAVAEDIGLPLAPVRVVKWAQDDSTNMDFAVFELLTDKDYPVVGMDLPMDAAAGDEAVVVHFSHGLGKQVGRPTVASRIIPEGGVDGECRTCLDNFYLSGTGLGPGASGAAVVSLRTGRIEGIVVGFADTEFVAEPISRFSVFALDKPEEK